MPRVIRHTDETAANAMTEAEHQEQTRKRLARRNKTKAQHEYFCRHSRRVRRILHDLRQSNFCMKTIGREHGTPHHTIMYIYERYIIGEENDPGT